MKEALSQDRALFLCLSDNIKMDIIGFISENWTVIGSSTILSILIKKLLDTRIRKDQMIFQSDLNKNLEKLKSDLKKENDTELSKLNLELTKLKAQLDSTNNRLQIAYSGIFKDQAKALKSLYTTILEIELALQNRQVTSLAEMTAERKYEVFHAPLKCVDKFNNIYYENALWIPKQLDDLILKIMGFTRLQHYIDLKAQAKAEAEKGNFENAKKRVEEALDKDMELWRLRDQFRDEIREVFGINNI